MKLGPLDWKLFAAITSAAVIFILLLKYVTDDGYANTHLEGGIKTPHNGLTPLSPYYDDYDPLNQQPAKSRKRSATKNLSSHRLDKSQSVQSFGLTSLTITDTNANCTFTSSTCDVNCNGGTLEETIIKINALFDEVNSCSSRDYASLIMKSTSFANNTINSGWLKDVKIGICNLNLISLDLEELGSSIFSGKPFGTHSNTMELTLTNTAVKTLRKNMFAGSSISSFEINFDSMREGIIIEEDVFGNTSSLIKSIIIKYCLTNGEALMNLTGKGSVLYGLQSMDLSNNLISVLENGMFSKTPNIVQLYLISSGITAIELGAFQGLSKIIQLHLTENNIKTLPEGLFDDAKSLLSLYISGNPWKCECNMQWFKDYLNAIIQVDSHKCRVGSTWIDMSEVEFCPENYSSTEKSTESTTASPSTQSTVKPKSDDFLFEKIKCRSLLMNLFDSVADEDKIIWYESVFKRRKIQYTFSEVKDSPIFILDLSNELTSTDFLIWTNVYNRSDYGCVFNVTSKILMALEYEETYTICLSSNDTTDTYALIADDCTAISTPPDWFHRAWLLNNQKTAVLLSTLLIFFITIITACGAVYYIVRYNPELIKANKRVLIVKRGSYSPNILVMPNKKERHISLCTDNGGYLTPKLKHWIQKSNPDMRYQELKTITKQNSALENSCEDNEKNIYEPPPIPPNHPTRRRDSGKPYFYSNM